MFNKVDKKNYLIVKQINCEQLPLISINSSSFAPENLFSQFNPDL